MQNEKGKVPTLTAEEMKTNAAYLEALTKPVGRFRVIAYFVSRVNGSILGPVIDKGVIAGGDSLIIWAESTDQAKFQAMMNPEIQAAFNSCETDRTKNVALSIRQTVL